MAWYLCFECVSSVLWNDTRVIWGMRSAWLKTPKTSTGLDSRPLIELNLKETTLHCRNIANSTTCRLSRDDRRWKWNRAASTEIRANSIYTRFRGWFEDLVDYVREASLLGATCCAIRVPPLADRHGEKLEG